MTYLSQPTLSSTHLYFITEEDLWNIPLSDSSAQAIRMTAGLGPISSPKVSPDGKWVGIASEEEGHCEVYLIPTDGGESKRLTYFGAWSYPVAWKDENTLVFKSNAKHAHRMQEFFEVNVEGGLPRALKLGEGTHIAYSKAGVVIERNMHRPDPAHWKRYRGGTMGQFWVSKNENESFLKLKDLAGNLSCPVWLKDRIYYLSDESGLGRIYSCDAAGGTKRIEGGLYQSEYYFRNLSGNGELFTFQSAGDLFLFDPSNSQIKKLDLNILSDHSKAKRKSVDASTVFNDYSLQPQGEKLLLEARGKVIELANFSGPFTVMGRDPKVRYKNPDWLPDGKRIVLVADDGLNETVEVYSDRGEFLKCLVASAILPEGFGRITGLKVSPRSDEVLVATHRNELVHLNLETGALKIIHQNRHQSMEHYEWSPDARFVAFTQSISAGLSQISIWEKETGRVYAVTEGTFTDFAPYFDSQGRYLYFLSKRIFNPIYDEILFDMTFPKAAVPMLIVLKKTDTSPFRTESALPDTLIKTPVVPKDCKEIICEIDFEGIQDRILQFPVLEAKYSRIIGHGSKVLWSYLPVEGTLNLDLPAGAPVAGKEFLDCFDFNTGKFEFYGTGLTNFKVRHESGLRIGRYGNQLRLCKVNEKPEDLATKDISNSKFGVINLARVKFMVDPKQEWQLMFRDAWRMQKEFYWRSDLNGTDWDQVYTRYLPIIEKVNCRREFSDVIWELVGELGTSHAYERGGDYRTTPLYSVGSLGAELTWNEDEGAYQIQKIYHGDVWSRDAASPLMSPGLGTAKGDLITEIAGVRLSEKVTPGEASLNCGGQDVWIKFKSVGEFTEREALVRLLKNDQALLYRDWVAQNRAIVKKLSVGKLGYIHIPNMIGLGFAEFHRNFMQEIECEGLVIDVRYNGGGHVSQLILDRLVRKPIGKSVSRWFGEQSVPYETPRKVAVALCNEFAGSDGDIFSHTFKLRKIGKLVGTRTWGGVVGIWPRNNMIDGGYTTQPEFSTWFHDVEYGLENHGAEPDVVVEFPPEAWRKSEDPQLQAAVTEAMKGLSC